MMRFLLWLVLIPTFTFAQNNTQNIRGVVTDKLSQPPLMGVAIQIGSLQKGATTDTLGKYSLTNIPPDRYEIKVSYVAAADETLGRILTRTPYIILI